MRAYLCIVGACVTFGVSVPGYGEVASDSKMAEEALLPYVGSKDIVTVQSRVLNEMQRSMESINADPNRIASGTVVFNTAMTSSQLRAMTEEAELTVFQVELKAPLGDDGSINSVSVGADDLTRVEGDLEERLQTAIAIARGVMLDMAQALDGQEAENYRAMAVGPFRIYSVRIFGEAHRLQPVMEKPNVTLLRLDTTDEFIHGHHQIKEKNAKTPVRWQLGRPPLT